MAQQRYGNLGFGEEASGIVITYRRAISTGGIAPRDLTGSTTCLRVKQTRHTGQTALRYVTRTVQQLDDALNIDLRKQHGWHDITVTVADDKSFLRRLAGHIENGQDTTSDPAFGG